MGLEVELQDMLSVATKRHEPPSMGAERSGLDQGRLGVGIQLALRAWSGCKLVLGGFGWCLDLGRSRVGVSLSLIGSRVAIRQLYG